MRLTVVIILLMLAKPAMSQHDLDYFRSTFHASQDEDVLNTIMATVPEEDDEISNATITAYKAVSEAMQAGYKFSPISKLQLFNSGRTKLEAVIGEAPTTEVRYLRLLIQLNVPGILNYNKNIKEDLEYIASSLKNEDLSYNVKLMFKNTLVAFAKDKEYLNIIEKIALH